MKRLLVFSIICLLTAGLYAQRITSSKNTNTGTSSTGTTSNGNTSNPLNTITNVIPSGNSGSGSFTNEQVVNALTDALKIAINTASQSASKVDGFYKNPLIFIPFPKEAEIVKTTVEKMGMQKQVDDFVKSLNRAAEEAAKESGTVFLDALKQMTITDGMSILKGKEDEATQYLHTKTYTPLKQKFTPIVDKAISKTGVTALWKPIIETYNKVPFVQKQNPDLSAYVTEKALDGVFKLMAQEEGKIRKDPAAWGNQLIEDVFGSVLGH